MKFTYLPSVNNLCKFKANALQLFQQTIYCTWKIIQGKYTDCYYYNNNYSETIFNIQNVESTLAYMLYSHIFDTE